MIRKTNLRLISLCLVILSVILSRLVDTDTAIAVVGLPGSPQFAYGAHLDIQGQGIRQAINLASGINLSWLLVDFDWSFYWPDQNSTPLFTKLDSVASLANEKNINLVVSISNPPDWAVTKKGPNPEKTSQLILEIAGRYPGIVLAFELFPSVNTAEGWSATPSPKQFTKLLRRVSDDLSSTGFDLQIISTLSPLSAQDDPKDIPDDEFLQGLYANGWLSEDSILGIRYQHITGDPLSLPSSTGIPVLRHYENLRNILVENHDEYRLIWITGFSWPGELATGNEPAEEQKSWLLQAYRLLTAQLYIGAAFFDQINPNSTLGEVSSLLFPDTTLHPACSTLSQLTNPTSIVVLDPVNKDHLLSFISKGITK